ncbi:DUF2244 domain-containing protein [Pelagimonas varians]|uniref:Integral membrane protein (DUF2244) n=1 Tax=Pelagimonas varians TaxID=696760 RepID=A0A238KDK1_9RHOB|nr:DUF2244 domain-containing protein [Pelagimonas varians]PYG30004.1 putative membrane protein [Pelagimonas varians]SMX40514.1 hypothetical protein PEV8663_02025 [Pelagimonas varians]
MSLNIYVQETIFRLMPYDWITSSQSPPRAELHLWPHNALSAKGFAVMVLGFFSFASMPLVAVLGTQVFWGLLPFILLATAALYYALRKNNRDRQTLEVLTITPETIRLCHSPRNAQPKIWEAQTYWVKLAMHPTSGPVPNYITLKGNGREVELGAFLSEDERKDLYADLNDRVRQMATL